MQEKNKSAIKSSLAISLLPDISKPQELISAIEEHGLKNLLFALAKLVAENQITEKKLFLLINLRRPNTIHYILEEDFVGILAEIILQKNDPRLGKLVYQLYKISLDRKSFGYANKYAIALFDPSQGYEKYMDETLMYADLAAQRGCLWGDFTKMLILWNKQSYLEAIKSCQKIISREKSAEEFDTFKRNIIVITDWLLNHIEINQENVKFLNKAFLSAKSFSNVNGMKNKCYHVMGLACYYLKYYKNVMLILDEITKDYANYAEITSIKKACYLNVAKDILKLNEPALSQKVSAVYRKKPTKPGDKMAGGINESKQDTVQSPTNSPVVTLPGVFKGEISFNSAWKKDSKQNSYNVVNTTLLNKIKGGWDKMFDLAIRKLNIDAGLVSTTYHPEYLRLETPREVLSVAEKLSKLSSQKARLEREFARNEPEARRKLRREKAEARYFDPTKTIPAKKNELLNLYKEIIDARFAESPASNPAPENILHLPLSPAPASATKQSSKEKENNSDEQKETKTEKVTTLLDKRNARQVFRAERLFQLVGTQLGATQAGKFDPNLNIPHDSDKIAGSTAVLYADAGASIKKVWYAGENKTIVVTARQRVDNSFLPEHGGHNVLYSHLKQITRGDREKEKILTRYMIRYARTFTPTTLEELQTLNPEATKEMVERFHAIYLIVTVKEQKQWLSWKEQKLRDGLAVAQARCLILLREGYLTFAEVFKKEAEFGVFYQLDLVKGFGKVKVAVRRVEGLYAEYIKFHKGKEHASFFAAHRDHEMVFTRQQARLDLREIYGGEESDCDEDGYESDLPQSRL